MRTSIKLFEAPPLTLDRLWMRLPTGGFATNGQPELRCRRPAADRDLFGASGLRSS